MTRITLIALAIALGTACWTDEPQGGITDGDGPTGTPPGAVGTGTSAGSSTLPCLYVGDQPSFANAATVRGRVVSPSGNVPVLSATVEVEVGDQAAWMLTQCDGSFEVLLPAGVHRLDVLKGRYTTDRQVDVGPNEVVDIGEVALDLPDVRIAVIDGIYDDIGALVANAGIPFDPISRPQDLLDDADLMGTYDVVFANCGSIASTTDQTDYSQLQFDNTRAWLEAGGTLYASDWEHELFAGAVPEAVTFAADPRSGPASFIEGDVLDRDIETILGKSTADLRFDLNDWAVIERVDYAFALVEGDVPGKGTHPLAALMPVGEGKAIFTSFHNESQITDDMEIILYEMILSL